GGFSRSLSRLIAWLRKGKAGGVARPAQETYQALLRGSSAHGRLRFVCCSDDLLEIAAQRLERLTLLLDLVRCPESKPPQDRNRRAPALHGVLEEKSSDQSWQDEPAAVSAADAGRNANESKRRGVGLDRPLDVPFLVQLA